MISEKNLEKYYRDLFDLFSQVEGLDRKNSLQNTLNETVKSICQLLKIKIESFQENRQLDKNLSLDFIDPDFSQDKFNSHSNLQQNIQSMLEQGNKLREQGNLNLALIFFNEAANWLEKTGEKKLLGDCNCLMGQIHCEQGNWELAGFYLGESAEIYKKNKNTQGLVQANIVEARIALMKGNYEWAQQRLESLLDTAQHGHHQVLIILICLNLSRIFRAYNRPVLSLAHIEEALRTVQKIINPRQLAEVYFYLGNHFQYNSAIEKALSYYELAEMFCHQHDFFLPLAHIWLNKARIFSLKQHQFEALQLVEAGSQTFINIENLPGIASACQIFGNILFALNLPGLSHLFLETGIEIFQDYELQLETAQCCENYAHLLASNRDLLTANKHTEMAESIFHQINLDYHPDEALMQVMTNSGF